jgi:osmotically-inducible protein OsmY
LDNQINIFARLDFSLPSEFNRKGIEGVMYQTVSDLAHKAQKAIMNNRKTEEYDIEILDKNGMITLRGSVPSDESSKTEEMVVEKVDGVASVINMLKIQSDSEDRINKINMLGMMK